MGLLCCCRVCIDPHTYPALVLAVEAEGGGQLVVFYISDGLIPDDDDEAWSLGVVPIDEAVLASANVVRRCVGTPSAGADGASTSTRASNQTRRLMDSLATGAWSGEPGNEGPAAFVRAVRERGQATVLAMVRDSAVK